MLDPMLCKPFAVEVHYFTKSRWARVYGAECIDHEFNLAEGENTSSTIRKHP